MVLPHREIPVYFGLNIMKYSPAELSYLRDSLKQDPPLRPDGRDCSEFRPIEGETSVLPSTNGSARVRSGDGGECLVGVKARVTRNSKIGLNNTQDAADSVCAASPLIKVVVDISGSKEDDAAAVLISSMLTQTLSDSTELLQKLRLTSRFSFQLYIDALVVSNKSHPMGLVSFAVYLALMTTRLPLLISNADDKRAEEVPVFHDDWEEAIPLCQGINWRPPLLFLLSVVESSILMDPTFQEEQVSNLGLVIGWSRSSTSGGLVHTIDLGGSTAQSIDPQTLLKAFAAVNKCGSQAMEALNSVIHYDENKDLFERLI